MNIKIIEGDINNYGGYSIDGVSHVNEVNEWEVNEAKNIAYATGRTIEDALMYVLGLN